MRPHSKSDKLQTDPPLYATLSSRPVLIVHANRRTEDDSAAVALVQGELGDKVLIVERREDEAEGDVIPRLFASTSIYRGLGSIKAFVHGIRQMKDQELHHPA
jgi:hypothetical protein